MQLPTDHCKLNTGPWVNAYTTWSLSSSKSRACHRCPRGPLQRHVCQLIHSTTSHFSSWRSCRRYFFQCLLLLPLWAMPPALVLYQRSPPVTDFICPLPGCEFFSCSALFVSMKSSFQNPGTLVPPSLPSLSTFSCSLPRIPCFDCRRGWQLFLGECCFTKPFWLTLPPLQSQSNHVSSRQPLSPRKSQGEASNCWIVAPPCVLICHKLSWPLFSIMNCFGRWCFVYLFVE